jgi:hypothetical protein
MAKGPVKSLNDYIANYQKGMSAAGPAYTKGIQNYNGNPMAQAATPAAMQAYQAGVMDSVSSGRRAAALNAADPAAWKSNAVTFGAPALATGAKKAEAKQRKKMASAPALWQAQRDTVAAMPQGHDVASATARVSAAMNLAKQAFGKS